MNDCPLCALREYARRLKEQNRALHDMLERILGVTVNEPDASQAATVASDIAAEALRLPSITPPAGEALRQEEPAG